ncbi:MAG: DUF2490 domain-containing protein, partial [Bacteroidota bacterium]
MMRLLCFISLIFGFSKIALAQNNRINTYGNIGWYNTFVTASLHDKVSLHGEYQWRRDEWITNGQQSLLRVGLNYHLKPNITFRIGYAWIETFAYGEIPINGMGKDFTEHRIYQMAQLNQKEGRVEFTHRFMLEQRFVGTYSNINLATEDKYLSLNRARYMLRMQAPLTGSEIKDKTPYVALFNEVFIGFGKNVNANVFDQNRIGV